MFKKGDPRPVGAGRKKGSLNQKTKNYLDFQMWFQVIKDSVENLEDKEKIEVAMRVCSMLFSKVNNLPMSPIESAENAQARQEMLEALENGKLDTDEQSR